MSFIEGVRTSLASPADDLYALVSGQLTAHAAWTFVEEYISGAVVYRVWKCLGSANGKGDFYVIFRSLTPAATTNTILYVHACEGYVAATHTFSKPCPSVTSSTLTINSGQNADTTYGTSWVLPANGSGLANNINAAQTTISMFASPVTTNATAYEYIIGVTSYGIYIGALVGTTATASFVGLFESLTTLSDPMPLLNQSIADATETGSFSRTIAVYNASATHHWIQQTNLTATSSSWTSTNQSVRLAGPSDALHGGPVASRVVLRHKPGNATPNASIFGDLRGLMKPDILTLPAIAPAGWRDTVTIAGEAWSVLVCTNNWAVLVRQAMD